MAMCLVVYCKIARLMAAFFILRLHSVRIMVFHTQDCTRGNVLVD